MAILAKMEDAHLNLYNTALAEKNDQYEKTKKSDSVFTQIKRFVPAVKQTENGKLCNYSSLQQTIRRLHKSFNAIYNRRGGKPRFKKTVPLEYSTYGDGWKIVNDSLRIQNVGFISLKTHRPIDGKIKSLVVKKNGDKFYACVACKRISAPLKQTNKAVGIDFGLKTFLTMSDGEKVEHSLPLKRSLKNIAKIHRQIKKAVESKSARKEKLKRKALRLTYEKTKNRRLDFAHKLSRKIVNENSFIAVEDLNLRGLTTGIKNINRKYSDVAVGMFYDLLAYKAESAGRQFVRVNPKNTSQACCKCGKLAGLTLKDREIVCDCGHSEDRDINAAKNILALGLKTVGLYGSLELSANLVQTRSS